MSRGGRWSCRGNSESKGEVAGTRNHSQSKPLLKLKETPVACSRVRHNGAQSGTHQTPASTESFSKGDASSKSCCQETQQGAIDSNLESRVGKKKTVFDQPLPIGTIVSVQFSRSVMSDSLWPHESQHTRPPCPSPTPRVHSNSRPLSQWCHPAISSSVIPFSSCPQSLPASESFPMSQLFAWGGQSTGVSVSASFLPDWLDLLAFQDLANELGWRCLIIQEF